MKLDPKVTFLGGSAKGLELDELSPDELIRSSVASSLRAEALAKLATQQADTAELLNDTSEAARFRHAAFVLNLVAGTNQAE